MRERISLNGRWQFAGAADENWSEGKVPGCVQLDLMAQGKLPDLFYRLEEYKAYALEDQEWVYRREFDFPGGNYRQAELVFEGLDTLAEIYLNGHYLGSAANMFIPHRYDVGDHLKLGANSLEVRLAAAKQAGKARHETCATPLIGGERVFLRKAQYSFGWDWAPRLVQTGIWRPVYLEFSGRARLANPFFQTKFANKKRALVQIEAEVKGDTEGVKLKIELAQADGAIVAMRTLPLRRFGGGRCGVQTSFTIANPQLWYPNGLGEQPLYQVSLILEAEEALDSIKLQTGIRTVKLLREQDAEGETFIFVVNGEKVFAKGANWVPADSLLPRLTPEDYEAYVKLARDSNMNMLRIWGGGIYEDPAFYEACDRAGIMIWQDFMYACAQYPDHLETFRKEARIEAESIIKRLRNHPSLVLWCGNNENSEAFHSWWKIGDPPYFGNYIYKQILPELCAELDPSRPYWVSSPYGGEDPNSQQIGDRHSWDVCVRWQDYKQYRKDTGRFLSEFGFNALPHWQTVLSYTEPEDRRLFSPVTIAHTKMELGLERQLRYLSASVGLPKDYQSFVYLTQFNQAEAIKMGIEHWRRRKFLTAGTLYWQFNDCWPGASWSCLDYYKRKKALYYYTKHFYADLLVLLEQEAEGIRVLIVNDSLLQRAGKLRLAAYSLSGERRGELHLPVHVLANAVTVVGSYSYRELGIGQSSKLVVRPGSGSMLIEEANGELLDSVLFVELESNGRNYRNYLVFDSFRNLKLVEPQLEIAIHNRLITVTSTTPAFGVFLQPERAAELSDDCLALEPGCSRQVTVNDSPGAIQAFDLTKLRLQI